MHQQQGFTICQIDNFPYLLPFGQTVADRRRGIRLNESGIFIWNLLKDDIEKHELLSAVFSHYDVPAERRDEVMRDTLEFLRQIDELGMIDRGAAWAMPDGDPTRLMIGGIKLSLFCPKEVYPQELIRFEYPFFGSADCTVVVSQASPATRENGKVLVRSNQLLICERSSDYLLLFPNSKRLLEGSIAKDGSCARFYLYDPVDEITTQELFSAIRLSFLYAAQLRGMHAIHSASILYRDKAWIFSGHSGMGKSTHAALWHSHVGTPLLNGDLNLLRMDDSGAFICGIPWCGTSGISDTTVHPLGGIILLGRSKENCVDTLSNDEQALLVMQRLISPCWTKEQLAVNLKFAKELSARVPVCRFRCDKTSDAVDTIRRWVDKNSGIL